REPRPVARDLSQNHALPSACVESHPLELPRLRSSALRRREREGSLAGEDRYGRHDSFGSASSLLSFESGTPLRAGGIDADGEPRVTLAAPGFSDDPLSLLLLKERRDTALFADDTGNSSNRGVETSCSAEPFSTARANERPGIRSGSRSAVASSDEAWEAARAQILREFGGSASQRCGRNASGSAASVRPGAVTDFASGLDEQSAERLRKLEGAVAAANAASDGLSASAAAAAAATAPAKAPPFSTVADDLIGHGTDLRRQLEVAWANDEKVTSLKLAIQLAKLLGETAAARRYPALFVTVTDALEAFGAMVFARIAAKAAPDEAGGPAGIFPSGATASGSGGFFSPAGAVAAAVAASGGTGGFTVVPTSAEGQETCRNWFYKTACIRELLPRLVIEAALLPCYRFLPVPAAAPVLAAANRASVSGAAIAAESASASGAAATTSSSAVTSPFPAVLARLGALARGIGDPLVAAYVRAYVARVGRRAVPCENGYATGMLHDHLWALGEVRAGKADAFRRRHGLGAGDYARLHAPAVDWLASCSAAAGAPRSAFTRSLLLWRDHCAGGGGGSDGNSAGKRNSGGSAGDGNDTGNGGSASLELLRPLLAHADPNHYAPHAAELLSLAVAAASEDGAGVENVNGSTVSNGNGSAGTTDSSTPAPASAPAVIVVKGLPAVVAVVAEGLSACPPPANERPALLA
ncbi:unnamed protein product, partial [Phaeothamnion confervicola]